jgi:hypothetical protein
MTDAPDEGRLELDDAGGVVDRSGAPSALVDLADPDATDHLAASRLESWVHTTASPWLRTRRRPVAAVVAVAVAVALGSAWWASRPGPPPPPPVLTLTNAPAVGADLGGPRIGPDGHLSVAYTARVDASYPEVDVIGVAGPGLTSIGVEEGADTLTGGSLAFVQLGAMITCNDRAIASATPSSYGIVVRTPGDLPGDDRLLAFDDTTTALDIAVRNACLATEIPPTVSVISADLTTPPGSSVVDVALRVRNDADVPLTVSIQRTPGTALETDLSPTVPIAPHSAATVPTRLLVHDCSATPNPAALTDLANPVFEPGYAAPQSQSGITVRVGLGSEWTNASYSLPWTVTQLADRLATACEGAPRVRAKLVDVAGSRSMDGSWLVTGTYDVRTSGIGIALGREHFTGPPTGEGSSLATTDSLVPGVRWVLAPTQLDGGAGRLPVTFSGISCDDRDRGVPTSMAVRVTSTDRFVYPFELPLDSAELRGAVDAACSPTSVVQVPDWGAVTPGATPAA